MRVCLDCPQLITTGSRCPDCTRAKARSRYSPDNPDPYDHAHRTLRRRYQQRMNRGEAFWCWRCKNPIDPEHWHLGHTDDGTAHAGPECPSCNQRAALRNRAARRRRGGEGG